MKYNCSRVLINSSFVIDLSDKTEISKSLNMSSKVLYLNKPVTLALNDSFELGSFRNLIVSPIFICCFFHQKV